MRILGVRFKNLNSLTGEWYVDFTHPAYASDGIFAITGPTGAGKTTIMDAVCLGLYGRTPRLDKVTKSSNEIMSRQTGECFAEVTFETQKGRYRCHWSQHRARKNSDGELQQAKHEIADADSGTVLESKINQVGKFIDNTTGMDFERFTRSMLLAQGGFACFLQAPPNERAPILEQITGTEIYSLISMKVHERRAGEKEKLELLQAELKGIQVLSEDEERELQSSLKEKQGRETEFAGKVNDMRNALTWLDGMFALEKELGELDKKQQDFEKRRQAFEPESKRLEKSMKALGLEGDYSGVAALRTQQDHETKELDGAITTLPEKDKAAAVALAAKQAVESGLKETKAQQQLETEIIKKVRDIDVRLSEQKKQIEEKNKAIGEIEKHGEGYRSIVKSGEQELKKAHAALKAIHEYRTKHAADAELIANLAAIDRSFALLRDIEGKHKKVCEELSEAARKKINAGAEYQKLEADHEKASIDFVKKQGEFNQLSDDISAMLKGRDISLWRSETDALKDRERLSISAAEIIERIDKAGSKLRNLITGIETSKAGHEKILDEIKSVAYNKSLLERDIENMETQVSLLSRIRDLEEDRRQLEDGKSCPLCGATDHPYARGNVPELNKAEATLKKTKTEYKKVSEKLSKLETSRARTGAEIQHVEKEVAEKKVVLDTDEKQCTEAMLALNIKATPKDRAVKVREELVNVQSKIAETSGSIAMVEEKIKKEKSAQTAFEKIREKRDKAGKALQDANHKLETADLEHERLTKN